jgi:hypothetical protein
MPRRPAGLLAGGQGVRSDPESEGSEEKYRAVIERERSLMNGAAKDGVRSSPHYGGEGNPASSAAMWVNPETFFDELPAVMKQVPPLPGEEALYNWIGNVLEAAAKDPQIKQTLTDTATAAEREMIDPFFLWRNNGRPAGNGWNSPVNTAQWGTDYLNRTATAKSNMYDNRPEETKYIYTDNDSAGKQLNGQNAYTITFAKVPPVKGFWSLTLYNSVHLSITTSPAPVCRSACCSSVSDLHFKGATRFEPVA